MHRCFPVEHLSLDERRTICERAMERCDRWWVDVLDCSVSWARQRVDMSFQEVMAKLDRKCLFNIIHRNGAMEDYLEVGFCTMTAGPDHFLWIVLHRSFVGRLAEIGYREPTPTSPA